MFLYSIDQSLMYLSRIHQVGAIVFQTISMFQKLQFCFIFTLSGFLTILLFCQHASWKLHFIFLNQKDCHIPTLIKTFWNKIQHLLFWGRKPFIISNLTPDTTSTPFYLNTVCFGTVLEVPKQKQKPCKDSVENSYILHTQFFLLAISMVHLLQLMKQYWYTISN